MSYWANKVVWITGATSGLGAALANSFALRGAEVAATARSEAALKQATARIEAGGGKSLAVRADITQQAEVDRAVARIIERFGRLDALINCAGVSGRQAVLETTPDDFQAMWELNVLGAVRCTRAAAAHLLESKGHLVNVGSLASKTAKPYLGAYPATKHALAAYTLQLRLELEPQGLHVLLVCPGPIAREGTEKRYEEQARDLPDAAKRPGGGASLRPIDPHRLSKRILCACEKRKPELVVPGKARLLFALAQLWPGWADRYLRG